MKTVRWSGGRMKQSDLIRITQAATQARSSVLDFMIAMTKQAIGEVEADPDELKRSKFTDKSRRARINLYIKQYLDLARDRDVTYGEAYIRRQRLAELAAENQANSVYNLFTESAEYNELVYELAVLENKMANPESGAGKLLDISLLLTEERSVHVDDIGEDTHFILSTENGVLPIPVKINGDRVLLGGLPKGCLIAFSDLKVVI